MNFPSSHSRANCFSLLLSFRFIKSPVSPVNKQAAFTYINSCPVRSDASSNSYIQLLPVKFRLSVKRCVAMAGEVGREWLFTSDGVKTATRFLRGCPDALQHSSRPSCEPAPLITIAILILIMLIGLGVIFIRVRISLINQSGLSLSAEPISPSFNLLQIVFLSYLLFCFLHFFVH